MPAGFLHTLCAKRACAGAQVTPVYPDVMILGAQGPDPLFTLGIFPLRLSSKPSPLGNLLHSYRTGAFLTALCRRAKAAGPVEVSYAMGFLTHYALDSTVHPYVYAHSNRPDGRYSSTLHMALEKSWDSLYYRREGHAKGTPVSMPGAAETRAQWSEIATLWAGAIMEVFPEQDVTDETILQALAYTERVNRLVHSPRGVKYRAVWLLERLIGKPGLATSQMTPVRPAKGDITNEAGALWHSPFEPEKDRNEGLDTLYEAATQRATRLLSAASGYFAGEMTEDALAEVIGNSGYDTGLPSKP